MGNLPCVCCPQKFNSMKYLFLFFFIAFCCFFCDVLNAQIISGTVIDKSNGDQLVAANVYDTKNKRVFVSNNYGFYSIDTANDTLNLVFSYVGYQSVNIQIYCSRDTLVNVALEPLVLHIIEIKATQKSDITERTQVSVLNIPIEQLKKVPTIAGEADIMKSLQLLPGIQFGQEGSSNLFVRGGSADQNLILLDDVPIYNVNHLFGFFSIFPSDAIKSVEVLKGGFPARYGGRLSSVIDIRTKEGNLYDLKASANVGIIASNITLEGPIRKGKCSFLVTGRRTYIDLLMMPFTSSIYRKQGVKGRAGYYFYDATGKIKYVLNDKNRFYLSLYMGEDKNYTRLEMIKGSKEQKYQSKEQLQWGNITASLRWNHIYNSKVFSNFTLGYTRYQFSTTNEYAIRDTAQTYSSRFAYLSNIKDILLKQDFESYINPNLTLRWGSMQSVKYYTPNVNLIRTQAISIDNDTLIGSPRLNNYEINSFIEFEHQMSSRLKTNLGIRQSYFTTSNYHQLNFEPRFNARFFLTSTWSLKIGYGYMTQNLHLLTNNNVGAPTDLWLPATSKIQPENSHQVAIGCFSNFQQFEMSIEGFYKSMQGLIEYQEGASFTNSFQNWEDNVTIGKGTSYGVELFVHKKEGKSNGWLSYTLSWSNRQFEQLNEGKTFPFKYDRRHYYNLFFNQQLNNKKRYIAISWTFASGSAVTIPTQKQNTIDPDYTGNFENLINGQLLGFSQQVPFYPQKNNYRMRDYHRLDISYNTHKIRKKGERIWSFGVYNLYARRNPFYLYQEQQYDEFFLFDQQGQYIGTQQVFKGTVIKEFSLFSIVPFISYQFKFQ